MGASIDDMVWTEVGPLLRGGAVAVLPIGAAAKEHGPHLPLQTDWLTAEALGKELARSHDVVVWPALGYGFYPAFVAYPGSTSVPKDVFEATVKALADDMIRAGARAILILNTGISTIAPIDQAIAHAPARAVHVYRGPRYLRAVELVCEQERGGHADEAETSILLHLHPEKVRMHAARAWTNEVRPGRWSPDDPTSASFAPLGVYGDPTLATAEKGATLWAAMCEDIREALSELREGLRDG